MSSGRSHVPRGRSTRTPRGSTPPSFGGASVLSSRHNPASSSNLRPSGKRPLTAKEADRREALARKRSSSRTRSSKLEPIIISDDEEEDQTKPASARGHAPQCKSGFPDPANIGGYGWKPPIDQNGPRIQPLAMIAPGQGSVDPDPSTVKGVLQRLENALKQVISIIGVRWGFYADFQPFLVSCLEEIRRVGGTQLALRCDRKLVHWDGLALRVEKLAFSESCNEVWHLISEARVKIMRERETRARRILEQEETATVLRERQRRLQCAMDAYTPTISQKGPTLEDLKQESTDVHRTFLKTMQTLHELYREEEASIAALSEKRLEKEAEAQVEANRAKGLADLKAELESFTVLDCAEG